MIVRKIDPLGRVCIPKSYRCSLNLTTNDPLELILDSEEIIIRKHETKTTEMQLQKLRDDICIQKPSEQEKLHMLFSQIQEIIQENK